MAGKASFSIREYGTLGKLSDVGVWIPTLNTGNITAQVAAVATLRAAIEDVIAGELQKETIQAQITQVSTAVPSDENAQRELKWHVTMREAVTGNPVSIEIPCALVTGLLDPNGEDMVAGAVKNALIAALEAVALSNDGNAVTVERIYLVGRRS